MTLPPFDAAGDLPAGIYSVTLDEALRTFGVGSTQRRSIAVRLRRVYELAAATGAMRRFVVFGSFITQKREPNDVDVFLVMEDVFDASALRGETALVFDHAAAQAHFGASVFWVRSVSALGGEQAAVEYWQVTRAGHRRGIIEIRRDSP